MKPLMYLLLCFALLSCAGNDNTTANSMTLYAPPFLKLKKGQAVQTNDGVYTPQDDEVWHSDSEYQDRVREALRP